MEKVKPNVERIEKQLLQFSVRDEYYGILLDYVIEIARPHKVRRVPLSHSLVAGVTSIRGEVYPVIQVDRLLYPESSTQPIEDGRFIVVDVSGKKCVLLVETVSEIIMIDQLGLLTQVEDLGKTVDGNSTDMNSFVSATIHHNNEKVCILNIEALITEIVNSH